MFILAIIFDNEHKRGLIQMQLKPFLLVAIVGLTACDTDGNFGREGSLAWQLRNMTAADKNAYFAGKCAQYGYETGTDAMRDCIADERRNLSGS